MIIFYTEAFKKLINNHDHMVTIKEIIEILAACLTPTVAIIGIYLAFKNYILAKRKRKDELFDRRYKFLKDFEKLWKTTGLESNGATRMMLEWDDIEPWAQEAYFLFGQDISDHLKSYTGKSFDSQITWVPDLELSKPFNKYLCFEKY
jgi:hypothetical protein